MIDEFVDIAKGISKGQYKVLGYGSARRVFDLNNGYVVKVAINRKGIAQNRVEYKISAEYENAIIARVISISEDYRYLIMEKAERLRSFSYVLQYYNAYNLNEILNREPIMLLLKQYHVLSNDLRRISSWGKINDKPVIIDYGFTKEVRSRYYSHPRFR